MDSVQMIKTVSFTELYFWDTKRYTSTFKHNFENAVSLKDILFSFKEKVSKEELKENDWQIIEKINFNGELFLRGFEEIENYKGSLFLVPANSIIYSKINVRHGCVYYHGSSATPFAVSNEYPVFTFDSNQVNGEFIKMLLRSGAFKELLNTKTSGISKARVKVEEFLSINIPLPHINDQTKMVSAYNTTIMESEVLVKKAIQLESNIDSDLGISTEVFSSKNKGNYLQLLPYSTFDKWGIDALKKTKVKYKKDFPIFAISQLCTVSSGGTPSRSNKDYYTGDIPWIKTGEVINDIVYDTEEKITEEAIKNSSAKLYKKGSLIIAMYGQGKTRGRTAKLGVDASTNQACAVLSNINNSVVLTDYLWIYLMNEYDRLRELASGNNQPNLNAQMIKNYPVIVPPLNIQKDLVEKSFLIQREIKELQTKAELKREQAILNFEQEIFKV